MASAITNIEELWNEDLQTIGDTISRFVGNELLSDMTFNVGPEKKRVPGHKFILAISSWDFYNALYLLRVDRDELPIEDVPYDDFMVFLKFCYTRNQEILENAGARCLMNLLKLAERFDMKQLKKICEIRILKNINYEWGIYYFQECDFLTKDSPIRIEILNSVTNNFNWLTQDERQVKIFLDLPSKKVEEILDRDDLNCRESDLLKILMKWSKKVCEKSNLEPTPGNLRNKLGNLILKIAFPAITTEEFTDILTEYPEVLTIKEITDILRKIGGKSQICPDFRNNPRKYKFTRLFRTKDNNNEVIPCTEFLRKEATSSEFSVRFKTKEKLKISQFAVTMMTPDKRIMPEICKLIWIDPDTSVEKCVQKKCRGIVNSPVFATKCLCDCDLLFFYFDPEVLLPDIWYTLYCKFPEPIPDRTNGIVNCAEKFDIEVAASESNLPPVSHLRVLKE